MQENGKVQTEQFAGYCRFYHSIKVDSIHNSMKQYIIVKSNIKGATYGPSRYYI